MEKSELGVKIIIELVAEQGFTPEEKNAIIKGILETMEEEKCQK